MNLKTFTGALASPFLMAALVSVTSTPASAQGPFVTTSYPGAMCRAINGADKDFQADFLGRLFNFSPTTNAGVVCPIPYTALAQVIGGLVRVIDLNQTIDMACNVVALGVNDGTATIIHSKSTKPSSGASSKEQRLDWSIDFGKSTELVLQCNVPPAAVGIFGSAASGIVAYDVVEDLGPLGKALIR